MNKFVLLSTALAFILPSASYGMEVDPQQHTFKRKYQTAHNQQYNEGPSLKKGKLQPLSNTERLSTPESHRQYLQDAIPSATKSILITSYGVDKEAFEDGGLYDLLADARNRGVKVYIYNIDKKGIDNDTSRFFQECDIAYDVAYTHAKLFAIDDKKVAIGSYNWLSKANSWENATFCLSGEKCKELVPLLWQDLKYYRNLQFGNIKQINQYQNNPQNKVVDTWELDSSTNLCYFHSLDQHRDFIADTFRYAQNSLVFCAPFINGNSEYQEDFEWNLLSKTINRDVHISFACRANDPKLPSFRNYLGTLLQSPFMHLIPLSDFHQKTVIVDDITIAEGSFNWLSASRNEQSEHHNHEVTLLLDGNQSKPFIEDFYKSRVGQEIVKATSTQNPQPNRSNELMKAVEPKFSSWQNNFKSSLNPKNFEILPGYNVGNNGFCVRFDKKNYLKDEWGKTIYFYTEEKAEDAAWELMPKNTKPSLWQNNSSNSHWQKNSKFPSKQNNFEILSGYSFGKNGYCVRFDKRDYLMDDTREIVYFPTKKEAQQAAYECQ